MTRQFVPILTAIVAIATACTNSAPLAPNNTELSTITESESPTPPSVLNAVQERGFLICGVDGGIPGFSFVDETGQYSGLDVDICKAIAAAVLGNPEAVEYQQLDPILRFIAVSEREVDILSRSTTWTLSRDTQLGVEFAPTTFYDTQGMMVRADSGITSLEDFQDKSVCVEAGTTTELNLMDSMRKAGVAFETLTFEQPDPAYGAYAQGFCQGITSDHFILEARRQSLPNPEEHILLEITLSKEPLAPATVQNDPAWFDVVKWVTFGLMEAEELGITQANIEEKLQSPDPRIRLFLGIEGNLGEDMGLSHDFMVNVVKAVGNYGEIYERNLGRDSPFNLPRGYNALWKDGGLMYSPPFR
ncbi:amino acid ABC transporter substrate-binding protein [Spirulina subsalsa]|uniref:amino acid ABC transporter substrate-binding protein n=1 Tax=Spirulina subsalsa TaxID=54311 RepID=UPI0003759CC8|nr:amino acid ABC transporter substrate-binding protein [Spirulina subsalsa]